MTSTNGSNFGVLLVMGDSRGAKDVRECLHDAAGGAIRLEHAQTLEDARDRITGGNIEVVLLDLSMSAAVETEAIERLDLHHLKIPFVVLSERDDVSLRERASELGARDFLMKSCADGPFLLEALAHAVRAGRNATGKQAACSGDLVVGPAPALRPTSHLVDSIVRSVCESMIHDLGDGTTFRFKPRAGDVAVARPGHLHDLLVNLVFGIVSRCRAEGGSDLSFDVKTFRCGSKVTLALHIDGCRSNDGTALLEPFLQGQTNASTSPRLALAARRLHELHGNIRFGNRPGVGPWIEIMVPAMERTQEHQRPLAQ